MTFIVSANVPRDRVADLMVSVVEGNEYVRQWCHSVRFMQAQRPEGHYKAPWYCDPEVYRPGLVVEVKYVDKNGAERKRKISHRNIHIGLQRMLAKEPKHFANFLTIDSDNITANVFWQCVVLGEQVY